MINIKRQILLVLLINKENGCTSNDMAHQLKVTPRTIRNNINQINKLFVSPIINYQKPNFYLNDTQKVIDYITHKQKLVHYPDYPYDRIFLIYFYLYNNGLVKIDELINYMHVSKNEIEKAIKQLRDKLPTKVCLTATNRGLYLKGDKIWQNYALANLATERISRLVVNQYLNLIFDNQLNIDTFTSHLSDLNKQIQSKYQCALNDRGLYILSIMHYLANGNQDLLTQLQQFQDEFVLANNNHILKLNTASKKLYQLLLIKYPHHASYLYQVAGNIENHLILSQKHPKYFIFKIKVATISGLLIKITKQDQEYFTYLEQQNNHDTNYQIVIYDPDIKLVADCQDQLNGLEQLFPKLKIITTNNLFDLDQLLHIANRQIIFVAKKARISLADAKYNIHFVHLDENSKMSIINLLTKGTH